MSRFLNIAVSLLLAIYAASAWSFSECNPPVGLDPAEHDNYCMIHAVRVACLVQKGYDLGKDHWSVPLAAYDECTLLGCNQLMKQTGALTESLFKSTCDIFTGDRSK